MQTLLGWDAAVEYEETQLPQLYDGCVHGEWNVENDRVNDNKCADTEEEAGRM